MNQKEQEKLETIIHKKIVGTEEEIEHLKELTKPIAPDNAIGRLSRMDAINNKTINDAALRKQKKQLKKLERALEKLKEGKHGNCRKCGDPIPFGRLEFMPWTTKCVKCA